MIEGGQGGQEPQNNDKSLLGPRVHSRQLRSSKESSPTLEER